MRGTRGNMDTGLNISRNGCVMSKLFRYRTRHTAISFCNHAPRLLNLARSGIRDHKDRYQSLPSSPITDSSSSWFHWCPGTGTRVATGVPITSSSNLSTSKSTIPKPAISCFILGWIGATSFAMAHLLAVAALHLGPVFGLRTLLREMALLLAVTTGEVGWILRLRALGGFMALLSTVAASKPASTGWAILSKVTHYSQSISVQLPESGSSSLSLHFLHSTPSAERGSVHSAAV